MITITARINTQPIIEIDRNNLVSFNINITDRANTQYPSYGIVSNSANLVFSDLDQSVLDLITKRILHSGIQVDVWLNNTDSGTKEQVCSMVIRELSYDNDNRQVRLSLKDTLEGLQDISVEAIDYDPSNPKQQDAVFFYEYLYSKTPSKYVMQSYNDLAPQTQIVLEETIIKYPLLESGTLWDSWQKLCELCLLHIYADNMGRTIVKYNNGN